MSRSMRTLGPFALSGKPIWFLAVLWVCFGLAGTTTADLKDSFEGPQPVWRLAEADCGVRLLSQQRTFRDAHSGAGCEFIKLTAGQGTHVYFSYPLGKAPIIAELKAGLWIKASKPNLQLMLRAVLPRSQDPRTGQPLTTLLRGDMYTEVGTWQRLGVDDLQRLLQREAVILRRQFGKEVDMREAFIDLVVLNAYSGEGDLDLTLDDLEIQGFVPTNEGDPTSGKPRNENQRPGPTQIAMQGSLLVIDGRPLFPRIIEQQGEPLSHLHSLGFNTILLRQPPTPEILAETRRLGLWLVAPPPEQITGAHDRVVAWMMGRGLRAANYDETRIAVEENLRKDPHSQRPTVLGVDGHFSEFSRVASVMLHERPVLGTSFELAEFNPWLKQRAADMRPGTPQWVGIDTIPCAAVRSQLELLNLGRGVNWTIDLATLRYMVYSALSTGARGLVFRSDLPLDDSPTGRLRGDVLKLINHELLMLEPWTSSGQLREELSGLPPQMRVAMLQSERSRIVLVTQHSSAMQYVTRPTPLASVSITVPGVPVSDRPFLLTPAGMKQVRGSHSAGGLRFTLEEPGLASAVVITQDPLAVTHLFRNTHDARIVVGRLKSQLTAHTLAETIAIDKELAAAGQQLPSSATWLRDAHSYYDESQRLLGNGDTEALHAYLNRVDTGLSRVRRGHWERTTTAFPSPASSVCCAAFPLLPLHFDLAERMGRVQWSRNLLAGGEMESLDQMLQAGWQQERRAAAKLTTDVALVRGQPHGGETALRLLAETAADSLGPTYSEDPSVTIVSAPFTVTPGQLLRIHGWVQAGKQTNNTGDCLLIYDSLTGPAVAERVKQTRGWREFTLYRVAPHGGPMHLVFALQGLGEASLDDVQVTAVLPEPIREQP